MRLNRTLTAAVTVAALMTSTVAVANSAAADASKPGQSMTHIKTVPGLASTLEAAGVVLYTQGGATSALIGDSLSAANAQVVFHVPVTGTKSGVRHNGSMLVLFNTVNNAQVQLQNPVVDLRRGVVRATVPQAGKATVAALTITNAASLKPVVKVDRDTDIRTTTYTGAKLAIGPGIGEVLTTLLGLPAGALVDGTVIATADITLNAPARG